MSQDEDILAVAREGFLDEARDMLRQFEQALLTMEQDPSDAEAVNSAFRAAHTVKGTAGLFGFDAVVRFTHEVESLLESMRSGELALSDEAMALLLQGRDQMERLLAEIGLDAQDPDVAQTSLTLGEALRALRERGAPALGQGLASAALSGGADPSRLVAESVPAAGGVWHISLRMGIDALRNGLDPLSFIRYLSTLGEVRGIHTVTDAIPDLAALDPESCFLGFEIRLATEADRATIEGVFEFMLDDCSLTVLAPDAASADYERLLDARAPDTQPEAREHLLAAWQSLAGPGAAPFIERREDVPERRANEPERRSGAKERRGGDETRFIRVRADKLDHLIDLIGELVIASSGAQMVARTEQSPTFGEAAQRISDLVQEARDGALGLRMMPIGETFSRFQQVVRDVSKQLEKDVELAISGGDTEMDKQMVETIADPLMHLVRNSLDHGLEGPAERLAAGKPAQGRICLNAYHESGSVVLEVSDDGRGLNRDRILAKAMERGLIEPDADLDDEQVYQLIFMPGFSTAEQVTNLSGRGVGMDVVKRNVEGLRGQIRVSSRPGQGATIQIRLPLTLAIIDGFLTSVGGVSYVLPLELVAECLEVPAECQSQPDRVAGHFDLRGEVLPYLDIGRFYRHSGTPAARRSLVLVRDGSTRVGLIVDRLHGEHQTVIKPLGQVFQDIKGLAGSTILGSGEVALILDVPALLDLATTRLSSAAGSRGQAARTVAGVHSEPR
ncbi:MAG TPA: chemotaxis protein CheA [Burkholderiaceae bacterium]|nr:chemotaxis protein CheA [Burkholderiaceae bacterium]